VSPGSGGCILIDPAWDVDELEALADTLDHLGLTPVAGLSTHAHFDHLLWHPRFGDVPRYASSETVRRAAARRAELLDELGPWPDRLVPLVGRVEALPHGPVPWNGPRIEPIVHDAHVPGHTAFWLPGLRILLAGDMLSDVEAPLPEEGPDPLTAYGRGLDALAPYVATATWVVPGHGTPASGEVARARLRADRRAIEDLGAR